MMRLFTLFCLCFSFSIELRAEEGMDQESFDQLPIKQSEIKSVTRIFWNAQSIQDEVKSNLPQHVRSMFTPAQAGAGCEIKAVVKTEGSADTCELAEDPAKMAKFIYNFNLSCSFGNYKVAICSREENKLLNQIKVSNPEKLVSDDNPFDLDSTM